MPDTTRDRIVEAATYLAQSSGIEALSMEAAADAAGVSRKTVYNYFDNKFSLADEVADQWVSQSLENLASITRDDNLDFVSKLNKILTLSFDRMHLGSKMMASRAKPQLNQRVNEMRRELRQRLRQFIQEIVQEAQTSGLILPSFETKRLAWIVINIVEGILIIDEIEDMPISKIDLLKDSLRAVIRGILSERGTEALKASPIFSIDSFEAFTGGSPAEVTE
ncbi:MAG: TetR/AcrR family transcriptional regulator [Spirochaetes bacterium]|nr:TetR/AcrR family transcriptional regulator [Spirochaetota bacterium]MBU0955456.1 TetR/AcrR family transcriptional regulator [Spirochaetota bacterium]